MYETMAAWDCQVTDVGETTFWAVMKDIKDAGEVELEAEIYISEVPESQLEFLQEGAIFYWFVGEVNGHLQNYMHFVQFPPWTQEEVDEINRKAKEMHQGFLALMSPEDRQYAEDLQKRVDALRSEA